MAKIDMKKNNIFTKRLNELLADQKRSRKDLSEYCNVTLQAVGKWVNGESVPDALAAASVANFFNVSSDYILGLSDNKTTNAELSAFCKYSGISDWALSLIKESAAAFPEEYSEEEYRAVLNDLLADPNFARMMYQLIKLKKMTMDQEQTASEQTDINIKCMTAAEIFSDNVVANLIEKSEKQYDNECDLRRYKAEKYFQECIDKWVDARSMQFFDGYKALLSN